MEESQNNNLKKEMIQKCKKIRRVITIFQWIIAILFIVIAIVIIANAILQSNLVDNHSHNMLNKEDNIFGKIETIINHVSEKQAEIQNLKESSNLILTFLSIVILLDLLAKIFKNIEENETPFTQKNIQYIKYIEIWVWILYILTSASLINLTLILAIVISALNSIFKYGYQLQIESDETL